MTTHYIIADETGDILRTGRAPNDKAAMMQGGEGLRVFKVPNDAGLIDDRMLALNLSTEIPTLIVSPTWLSPESVVVPEVVLTEL